MDQQLAHRLVPLVVSLLGMLVCYALGRGRRSKREVDLMRLTYYLGAKRSLQFALREERSEVIVASDLMSRELAKAEVKVFGEERGSGSAPTSER